MRNTYVLEIIENKDSIQIHEQIEILSTDDEKIKLVANLLGNDSSRNILKLLFEQEMTANEIAQKTGMLISLVIHYLQRMQEAGIIKISKIGKNTKGHDMKYYSPTKLVLIILPSKFSDKAKKSKSFNDSIKRIISFSSIGVAAVFSWFATFFSETLYPAPTLPPYLVKDEVLSNLFWPTTISLIVVIIGMIIERIMISRKLHN